MLFFKFIDKLFDFELSEVKGKLSQPQIEELRKICLSIPKEKFVLWFAMQVPNFEAYIKAGKKKKLAIINSYPPKEKALFVFSVYQYLYLGACMADALNTHHLMSVKEPKQFLALAGRVNMLATLVNQRFPVWPFAGKNPYSVG